MSILDQNLEKTEVVMASISTQKGKKKQHNLSLFA